MEHMLSILRNPYGRGEMAMRKARLTICDEYEKLVKENKELKKQLSIENILNSGAVKSLYDNKDEINKLSTHIEKCHKTLNNIKYHVLNPNNRYVNTITQLVNESPSISLIKHNVELVKTIQQGMHIEYTAKSSEFIRGADAMYNAVYIQIDQFIKELRNEKA